MNKQAIIQRARDVLDIEVNGLLALIERLDDSFYDAVEVLGGCSGKVVVTGMGKSGLICRKIAATLASTGTPSFFLHSGDALHGDLGMVMHGDVILAVSNSGETEEILKIIPLLKLNGLKMVAMTGNSESTLAKAADVVLDVSVKEEACPLGLAPTASTTATLAMGDALAVVLLEKKGFREQDFALRHPGGILGRRLLLRVEDLMHSGDELPLVQEQTSMQDTVYEISSKRLGVTGVVNLKKELVGIITDGDLRRGLQNKGDGFFQLKAEDLMSRNPKTIAPDNLATDAVVIMERNTPNPITSLFVLKNGDKKPRGVVHIHDLIKAGLA